jgi:hypothetical protein
MRVSPSQAEIVRARPWLKGWGGAKVWEACAETDWFVKFLCARYWPGGVSGQRADQNSAQAEFSQIKSTAAETTLALFPAEELIGANLLEPNRRKGPAKHLEKNALHKLPLAQK